MMKRLVGAALAAALVLTPLTVLAQESDMDLRLDEDVVSAPVMAMVPDSLPAKSAILLDQESGQVLYEQNSDEQLPPASVTKIMTLLLVMEALDTGKITLEDMVTCSENANSMGGSQIWFKVGEQMSVNDLLKAVAIASANDASVALGEHVSGSEEAFVELMNTRAAELGMENTTFLNCTGLDAEGHLTTARDIALMSRELLKHPLISEYSTVWMDSLRNGTTELVNTNKLVRFYDGCTGLKTGTTDGAGSCLSASATRDGLSLVAVVMGCATSDDRFSSARGLLDHGFANYMSVTPASIDAELAPVKVLKGVTDSVMPVHGDPGNFVVDKNLKDEILQEVTLVADVEAPVAVGQVLGKVEVVVNGTVIGSYDLTAAEEVQRMTFGRAFQALLLSLLQMTRVPPAQKAQGGEPQDGEAAGQAADAAQVGESESTAQGAAEGESAEGTPPETPAAEEGEAAEEPCACGKDTCYCADIGNVCGCLTE